MNEKIVEDQTKANRALQDIEPAAYNKKALVVDSRPWYGGRAVQMQNGMSLPNRFTAPDGLVLTFEGPTTLADTARMIQAATGIRTVVNQNQNDSTGLDKGFLPIDGVQVTGGRVVWKGALNDLLAQLSDAYDAEWEFDGNNIFVSSEITRTFMLHALADSIDFKGSIENQVENTSALPEVGITSSSTLEIWADIEDTVNGIINQRGRASFSPTTGTITVSGPATTVRRVEHYLRDQNAMRLRRVAVAVKVLSVETSDENTLGFNLSGLIEEAINGRPFQFSAVGDGLTAGILRTLPQIDAVTGLPVQTGGISPNSDEISSIIQASEDVQRVSLSNSGAIVTLSDIPAPLQIGRTISYLARVSSTTGDDSNVSLEPGEVNLGLTMNVLPRVIQRDKILLRLGVGITDAPTPFEEISVGDLRIQLPSISTTGFLQNAILSQGETLVLAGFEKDQATLRDQGVPGGFFTGGTRSANRSREVTVLLITAEVLPEEPLTVMGR